MTFDVVIYSILIFLSIILFAVVIWRLFNRYIKLSKQKESDKLHLTELGIDIKSLLVLEIVSEYIKSLP